MLIRNMWQSRVEIEEYFITYFDPTIVFEALYPQTFVKSGIHTRFVELVDIHTSTQYIWAHP